MAEATITLLDLTSGRCKGDGTDTVIEILTRCLPGAVFGKITDPAQTFSTAFSSGDNLLFVHATDDDSLSDQVKQLRKNIESVPIVGLLCTEDENSWSESAELFDEVVFCPFRAVDFLTRVKRICPTVFEKTRDKGSRNSIAFDGSQLLIGESQNFLKVLEKARVLAESDGTILITGETGTGKDLLARGIHTHGPRKNGPFVPVNSGAIPEQLIESELFGCVRGAFTGATETRAGLIAEAEGGTLFLDEIDTLCQSVQVKLLRFLQDRCFRPVGSAKSRCANVRVIAATNADLRQLVERKVFREDLYFRLNVLPIQLPPLRERIEDIPLLARYFVDKYAERRVIGVPALSPGALQKLVTYIWPGNVRELEGVIQRGLLLSPLLPLSPDAIDVPISPFGRPSQGAFLREAKADAINQFERLYLVNLLSAHRGNVSQAAKAAGKERRTFQRLLTKHGLHSTAFRAEGTSSTAEAYE